MVCKSCGNNNPDGAKFCDNCGVKLEEENVAVEAPVADSYAAPDEPVRGTKWASFLGYFALWAGAIMNFVNAFSVITGAQYNTGGASANVIYQIFKPLKVLDIVYGLLLFVLVAWGVFAAVSIIAKKKTALWAVPFLYLIVAGVSLIYSAAASLIISRNCFDTTVIASLLVNACMFSINYTYFDHRKNIYTK